MNAMSCVIDGQEEKAGDSDGLINIQDNLKINIFPVPQNTDESD